MIDHHTIKEYNGIIQRRVDAHDVLSSVTEVFIETERTSTRVLPSFKSVTRRPLSSSARAIGGSLSSNRSTNQLKALRLEIVMIGDGCDNYVWRIDRRSP